MIQLSAVDENQSLLFCLSIAFSLSSASSDSASVEESIAAAARTVSSRRVRRGTALRTIGNQ